MTEKACLPDRWKLVYSFESNLVLTEYRRVRARFTASVISGQATEILKDEYISWNIGFADMEVINLQLVKKATARRKMLQWLFSFIACGIVIIFAALIVLNSLYLSWDYSDPEMAVAGVLYHAAEWLFVRLAPIILIGAIAGIFLTRKKD